MMAAMLISVFQRCAGRTLSLRAGVVAVNFAVMMGLAALLGLDLFGQLVFLWGAALVAGTALSLGGPLILLRGLTDGGGMRVRDIIGLTLAYPFCIGILAWIFLNNIWPDMPWAVTLLTGFMVNLLTCLASLMRALGSLQWSMALRDAGPQVALGLGAVAGMGAQAETILMIAAIIMVAIALLASVRCWTSPQVASILGASRRKVMDLSLWGTSVLGMAIAQMDLIVGGTVLSSEALGVYALLRRVANLVALPVSVATWVSSARISKAYGSNDAAALQDESTIGSQIAFVPGAALFLLGATCLPGLIAFAPGAAAPFGILLCGAVVQVVFASGFTVATLCAKAHAAALARLSALMCYLAVAYVLGTSLSPISNALTYVAAMTLSSVWLWLYLKRKLDIDTSAFILWGGKARAWRPS